MNLAADLERLTAEYERMKEQYAALDARRGIERLELRQTAKTMAEADMLYDASENGQQRTLLKHKLDIYEQKLSAKKNLIQLTIAEMRHLNQTCREEQI
jgi:hypothetical protein